MRRSFRRLAVKGLLLLAAGLVAGCTFVTGSSPDRDEEENALSGQFTVLWGEKMGVPHRVFLLDALESLEQVEVEIEVAPFGEFYGGEIWGDKPLIDYMEEDFEADLIVFDSRMLPLLIRSGYLEPYERNVLPE